MASETEAQKGKTSCKIGDPYPASLTQLFNHYGTLLLCRSKVDTTWPLINDFSREPLLVCG
jgi:hypothetical protein